MFTGRFHEWSGVAFAGKFGMPLILLVGSWLAAFPIRDPVTMIIFLLTIVPMALAGVLLLLVPGQLKSEGRTIMFRRWFRWQTLPTDEIEAITIVVSVFGSVRFAGTAKKLIFFVEPENRHLLGFGAHSESLETRLNTSATHIEYPYDIVDVLSGGVGFVTGIFWLSLAPPFASGETLPRWFIPVFNFEGRHPHVLTVLAILILLTSLLRGERKRRSQRVLAFYLLGIMVSRFFVLK